MSKSDRMDYAIQKAVELGVTEITPLTSERCELRLRGEERAEKKIEHWQRVAYQHASNADEIVCHSFTHPWH